MLADDVAHWPGDVARIVRDTVYDLTHNAGYPASLLEPQHIGGVHTYEGVVDLTRIGAKYRLLFVLSFTDDPKETAAFELYDEREPKAALWDESYSTASELRRAMQSLSYFITGYMEGLRRA